MTPPGLAKPKRAIGLIPLIAAVSAVFAVLLFAIVHLAAKGPAPQLQAADPYNLEDLRSQKPSKA